MRIVVQTLDRAKAAATLLAKEYLKHKERGLMVTIEPYSRPATRSQGSKIHAMLADLADGLGYHRDEMKEVCKRLYWPVKEVNLRTGPMTIPKSTAELSVEEGSLVIEKLHHIAAECGVTLKGD